MKILDHELYRFVLPLMTSNMYVMISGNEALIIDPNPSPDALKLLKDNHIKKITVILTHEHFDHISGVNGLREYASSVLGGGECTVYADKACAEAVKDPGRNLSRFFEAMFILRSEEERMMAAEVFDSRYFCEADVCFEEIMELSWDDLRCVLRETPGHSAGSICVEIRDADDSLLAVATGDSLVEGNKVITRFPGGSKADYNNITRPYLESIGPDILILPGHGEISLMRNLELG